ncbi:MAG: NAD(P)H-binding protein [Anaerolineales bacterium]|nr:NAD(P)H-binding protein [Chloroflexota bacterium]MBL7162658.1 NAD(P)H-binding protein [Anaerolineales bacterium]
MKMSKVIAITGAFGYSGKYITTRLLAQGHKVITLTGHPDRENPFGDQVQAYPFHFDDPDKLIETLHGVDTLYNTYWVRFSHGGTTFEKAVNNTRTLFNAAKQAGVRRVVHVSITNPEIDSPLPYFQGKAQLEADLQALGLSYAIIRPTVIFGKEDILINNIAYLLRRFPIFAIPGSGDYRLQPIFAKDLADIAVKAGERSDDLVIDAVGPKIYTFKELVKEIREAVGGRALLIHIPPLLALTMSRLLGLVVGDVVLTHNEVRGLMANLLISDGVPTGQKELKEWLHENTDEVGTRYASELKRHYLN